MRHFLYLLLAIVSEVIATSSLKASQGFSRLWPSLLVVVGYGAAFYWFSLSLKQIPLGIAYAIWSGLGTVGVVLIGLFLWGETLNALRVFGIALILIGTVILNLSKAEG
ncbi:small multidrug resistance pump [Planifilum fulgidum]|uniref:Small multidrug resistance pump n=1 Tax=Planifilum fulgidum TaxID=201973 RepID=A0A1I2QLS1_9BACL|nr:multidrug efflux SMR transporter [Planifilum fulgidum]MBO2497454.1 QacE family quaternary ammonium compound efflux SMR transporter [Bacillota bacterium]MBO2532537.1 QacE family quaternary ammonium compound efflux SMR transporter [Thermoactinomycetaceae bacterium]SFG29555.1 small multidrug resistance pump [Planifilum fulgidum]